MLAVSYEDAILKKENRTIKGIIIRSRSQEFTVLADNTEYLCVARGNLKIKDKKLITGDRVEFSQGVIESIYPRKTMITRPKAANIDCVNIVIATRPQPDYLLVDKMIVQCRKENIEVFITVNKCDEDALTANYVAKHYKDAVDGLFFVSAQTGVGIDLLKSALKNRFCCLAGQSAVGKTSICNRLFEMDKKVNSLSDKTLRGRHTTTSREIHYGDDLLIIDTPGFSALDTYVESKHLHLYYKEFAEHNGKCYYIGCMHIEEPDCLVKDALKDNLISKDRYDRYVAIFKELKEYEKRKY